MTLHPSLPDPELPRVEKATAWMSVSAEALEDAHLTHAMIEWALRPDQSLTLRERLTGWTTFTSSQGYSLTFRVGWRLRLYYATHPLEWWRRAHPEPECDD